QEEKLSSLVVTSENHEEFKNFMYERFCTTKKILDLFGIQRKDFRIWDQETEKLRKLKKGEKLTLVVNPFGSNSCGPHFFTIGVFVGGVKTGYVHIEGINKSFETKQDEEKKQLEQLQIKLNENKNYSVKLKVNSHPKYYINKNNTINTITGNTETDQIK